MSSDTFFTKQTPQSKTKATIISKYAVAWAKIVAPKARKHGMCVQYADLCAGRGRYERGEPTTPLLVLVKVIQIPKLHDMFVAYFSDANPTTVVELRRQIESLPGIER